MRRVGATGNGDMKDKVSFSSPRLVGQSAEHKSFISRVFDDLESLEVDKALKIPLSDLPDSGANTLTLLHSVARQKRMVLEVRADRDFLYVWNYFSKALSTKL